MLFESFIWESGTANLINIPNESSNIKEHESYSCAFWLLGSVPVSLAVFHDHEKILLRVLQQMKIFDGVSIDNEQVGVGTFLNNA